MEPLKPPGHRRRRSSLASPAPPSSSRRHRSLSARGKPSGSDEPKISEEGLEMIAPRIDRSEGEDLSDEDLHDDEEVGLTGKDKRRKRQKRHRNTRLDQRIVREKIISDEEKKVADRNVLRRLLINASLIGLWYFFSLCISLVRISWHSFLGHDADHLSTSTTNGCLILRTSTFHTHYLRPLCTCSCSFPWLQLYSFSFLRYDPKVATNRIWASQDTVLSPTGRS